MNKSPKPAAPPRALTCAITCALALLLVGFVAGVAQQPKKSSNVAPAAPSPTPSLKRTQSQNDVRRLGFGGSLTLYGAPDGSIEIEGWPRSEVEMNAEVELHANSEEELTQLASVNRFVVDDDLNHVRVITTGTHDRKFMKRAAKDFPKKLLGMPWKINYRLRVPAMTDLEIYAGRGPLRISGIDGALRLNAGESDATFVLVGGDVEATVQRGSMNIRLTARSWRGRGANFRLGSGDMTVELPANFNGDLNAEVLHTGRIENSYVGLAPRERTQNTERAIHVRGGMGGTTLSFTVGNGTLRIKQEGGNQ